MKTYPSIPHLKGVNPELLSQHLYVFDKLDGSNIRAEWNPKRGFYKFGSRKVLINEQHPILGTSIPLIQEKYGDPLHEIFKKQKWKKAIAFFEFHGPNSFAGYHDPNDEHTVTLFDVTFNTQGFLHPKDFTQTFQYVDTPALLHKGPVDSDLIHSVHEGTFSGVTYEGVVCKGENLTPGIPFMLKIKSKKWIQAVHSRWEGNLKEIQKRL